MKTKLPIFFFVMALLSGCAIHAPLIIGGSFVKNTFQPTEFIAEYIPQGETQFKGRYFLVIYEGGPAFYEYHGEDQNTLITNVLVTDHDYQFGIWVPDRLGAKLVIPKEMNKPLLYTLIPGHGYRLTTVYDVRFPEPVDGVEAKTYEFMAVSVKNIPGIQR